MNYWLIKSEGESYSIDDLKRDKVTAWEGIRNYAARNFMMKMKKGDLVLFYHSNANAGVYGIAKITSDPHADETQFDKKNYHFEPRATKEKPVWYCVDVGFVEKFKEPILREEIKLDPKLAGMIVLTHPRLSVQPVSEKQFMYIRESLS
jgi:predicted RNA-binding protein with PUA-like domain